MAQQTIIRPSDTHEQRLPMAYEDFLALVDEGIQAEWVHGEAIIFMPPKIRHQLIAGFLYSLLSLFVHRRGLGVVLFAPTEMRAFPTSPAREPDVLFIAREHLERLTERRVAGPADLVVEILSEESARRDRTDKFYEYQEAGVREYLLVEPRPDKQRIDLYGLTGEGKYQAILPDAQGRYHSLVLPGFWIDPVWLWEEPLPDPSVLLTALIP